MTCCTALVRDSETSLKSRGCGLLLSCGILTKCEGCINYAPTALEAFSPFQSVCYLKGRFGNCDGSSEVSSAADPQTSDMKAIDVDGCCCYSCCCGGDCSYYCCCCDFCFKCCLWVKKSHRVK